MFEQPLRVDALDEEPGRPRLLDRICGHAARLHRQPENLDVRQRGVNTGRCFDAVHVRHGNVHEDDVRPQRVRLRDRFKAVGRVADDRELRLRREPVAERPAHRRVIVDDENPEDVRGQMALLAFRCRADRCDRRHRRGGDGAVREAARRDEPHTRPFPGRAVDLEASAEQRETLVDAEEPPTHLAIPRPVIESCRLEADALIGHGDAQLVGGVERELQRHPIRLGVLDRIEQEFSDRLEEQRADLLAPGIGTRVGADPDVDLVLVLGPVGEPRQCGG